MLQTTLVIASSLPPLRVLAMSCIRRSTSGMHPRLQPRTNVDARKLVHVRCRCKVGEGIFLIISDQGQGFDPRNIPDPLAVENLEADHGRGIQLMKWAMDEVSFQEGGTEVRMCKRIVRNRPKGK